MPDVLVFKTKALEALSNAKMDCVGSINMTGITNMTTSLYAVIMSSQIAKTFDVIMTSHNVTSPHGIAKGGLIMVAVQKHVMCKNLAMPLILEECKHSLDTGSFQKEAEEYY